MTHCMRYLFDVVQFAQGFQHVLLLEFLLCFCCFLFPNAPNNAPLMQSSHSSYSNTFQAVYIQASLFQAAHISNGFFFFFWYKEKVFI